MGFRLFNILIGIVLAFEFCHDITIMKMTIFNKVKLHQHKFKYICFPAQKYK